MLPVALLKLFLFFLSGLFRVSTYFWPCGAPAALRRPDPVDKGPVWNLIMAQCFWEHGRCPLTPLHVWKMAGLHHNPITELALLGGRWKGFWDRRPPVWEHKPRNTTDTHRDTLGGSDDPGGAGLPAVTWYVFMVWRLYGRGQVLKIGSDDSANPSCLLSNVEFDPGSDSRSGGTPVVLTFWVQLLVVKGEGSVVPALLHQLFQNNDLNFFTLPNPETEQMCVFINGSELG